MDQRKKRFKDMRHFFRFLFGLFVLGSSLLLPATNVTHAAVSSCVQAAGVTVLHGNLGGSYYTISVPGSWNGTLLLYNHGYVYANQPLANPALDAPDTQTETALLQQGFALAGDSYSQNGWAVEQALHDQIALLDFFQATCGQPARTITWGGSMGGLITAGLAQLFPQRFSGALSMCGALSGSVGLFNVEFDRYFAINALLANSTLPVQTLPPDPTNLYNQAQAILATAQQTPQGRARIALASAFSDTPGWYDPASPEPARDDYATQEQNQFLWNQVGLGLMLFGGAEVEMRAGGNPVWNVGVDYRQQLLHSVNRREVQALYQQAGLDLTADLATLNASPHVSPDPQAVAYMNQNITLNGELHIPLLTVHTTGDGLAFNQVEQDYASQVKSAGDSPMLRQLFIHRANHCSFTPAEELTVIHALIHRLDHGTWDASLRPDLLNQEAAALGPTYNTLPISFGPPGNTMPPAFITFHPATFLRPESTPPAA
jgi:pimeloyl-ACP methyl ester carboxylesterase